MSRPWKGMVRRRSSFQESPRPTGSTGNVGEVIAQDLGEGDVEGIVPADGLGVADGFDLARPVEDDLERLVPGRAELSGQDPVGQAGVDVDAGRREVHPDRVAGGRPGQEADLAAGVGVEGQVLAQEVLAVDVDDARHAVSQAGALGRAEAEGDLVLARREGRGQGERRARSRIRSRAIFLIRSPPQAQLYHAGSSDPTGKRYRPHFPALT